MGGFAGLAGKPRAQSDKEFVKKATPTFMEVLQKLGTPLGKIAIDVIDTNAVTTIKGKEAGTGNFEKVLPVGNYELVTTTTDYEPYQTTVKVEPQKLTTVRVTLIARALTVAPVTTVKRDDGRPSAFKRPGLYIAIAGIIAAGVGIALGQSAKGVESRSAQLNDMGVSPITRAEANGATTNALLGQHPGWRGRGGFRWRRPVVLSHADRETCGSAGASRC